MKLIKSFWHALNMVRHSKLRSWLTILGIVIGVASVIAILSMGEGMQQSVNSQLGDLGADILTITPGFSKASKFSGPGMRGWKPPSGGAIATTEEIVLDRIDLQALKGIPDIKYINPIIRANADVYFLAKKGSVSVTGIDTKVWSQITINEIADGRMLGPSDTNVVVIGGRLSRDYFDKPIGINQMITINNMAFRVVGILDNEGSDIFMPLQSAYQVLDDKEKGIYDSFEIKVKNEEELDLAIENIERKLMNVRHVTEKNKDFSIYSSKETAEKVAEMMGSMTIFLAAIAAVALLVGAVGIANTMFTSVLEKTKEIGIMKAVGARNKDIMTIFLLNSVLIALIGGIIGVILGYLLSDLLPILMGGAGGMTGKLGSSTIVTMESVVLSLSISVIIGTLSGVIPAYQASKLKPVDALRHE